MPPSRKRGFGPLCGVAAVVLLLPGFVLMSKDAPKFMQAGPARYRDYYDARGGEIRAGAVLMILAVFFLLWFVGHVRTHLRTQVRAGGGDNGHLGALAQIGGSAGALCLLLATVVKAAPALRLVATGSITGAHAAGFSDAAGVIFGLASPVCFAVATAACAVAGFRLRALPAWLSWATAVLAVVLVIPFVGWIGLLLFPVWLVVLSVHLFRAPRARVPQGEVAAT
jgi:hypothetical protein